MLVDERHSGSRVEVRPGEMVTVRLKENPTTGYRWAVEQAGGLRLESDHHAGAGPAPGAAGVRELGFRASERGEHVLRLKQWRDWQGEGSVVGRFQLSVQVD
jgi:inhibitor of cysteine peptidase